MGARTNAQRVGSVMGFAQKHADLHVRFLVADLALFPQPRREVIGRVPRVLADALLGGHSGSLGGGGVGGGVAQHVCRKVGLCAQPHGVVLVLV